MHTRTVIFSSFWTIGMRWASRCIGFVSTLILVRLLTPNDFGVVAKAMLVVAMLEMMAETGQRLAIIRHPAPTQDHYDTAWTISIIINSLLAFFIFLASPLANILFGEPRAELVVQLLSLRTLLNGFENIGTVDFRRDMNFSMDFRFNILRKIFGTIFTLALAYFMRDYMALIVGIIVGQAITLVLSYVMSPYRPKLSLKALNEIFSFSAWVLVSSTGSYLVARLDQWAVGLTSPSTLMGEYTIASEFAQLPTSEIIDPMARALYPAYCRLRASTTDLVSALISNLQTISIIVISAGVGLAMLANDFTIVVLGYQWQDASKFIFYIALSGAVNSIAANASIILNVVGDVRRAAFLAWARVVICGIFILIGMKLNGVLGVAQAQLASSLILAPTFFYHIANVIPLTFRQVIGFLWRPLLAAGFMVIALEFSFFASNQYPIIRLFGGAGTGVVAFMSALFLLWILAGHPPGTEASVVGILRRRFVR